jgi:hypothetical protein
LRTSISKRIERIPDFADQYRLPHSPHTAWELLEHIRLAQWDILEFSRDAKQFRLISGRLLEQGNRFVCGLEKIGRAGACRSRGDAKAGNKKEH